MPKPQKRFRIVDLLTGKTLVEADRGRDLVAYHAAHYQRGRSDWWWLYRTQYGWSEIPVTARRSWLKQSAEKQQPPQPA